MGKTPSSKTSVSRSENSTSKTGAVKRKAAKTKNPSAKKISAQQIDKTMDQLKELGNTLGKAADKGVYNSTDTTHDQLNKIKDILSEATDKGVHTIKELAEKIHLFASEATELTKLKIELHNLQKERDKFLLLMGEQLRNLYKSNKVKNIKTKFKYDFQKLDEIEANIAEREKEVSRLSTDLKSIT